MKSYITQGQNIMETRRIIDMRKKNHSYSYLKNDDNGTAEDKMVYYIWMHLQ